MSANPNINCLDGMRCPECGSYGPFNVTLTTTVIMSDDGWSETAHDGDEDWTLIACRECDKRGPVSEFRDPGDDDEDEDAYCAVSMCFQNPQEGSEYCIIHAGEEEEDAGTEQVRDIDLPSVSSPADGEPSGLAPTRDGG